MMFCEGIVIFLVSREAITYKLDLASFNRTLNLLENSVY
jgi:hypothetical protein